MTCNLEVNSVTHASKLVRPHLQRHHSLQNAIYDLPDSFASISTQDTGVYQSAHTIGHKSGNEMFHPHTLTSFFVASQDWPKLNCLLSTVAEGLVPSQRRRSANCTRIVLRAITVSYPNITIMGHQS